MAILIKGMEMPTDDMKNIMIFADGRVFQFSGYGNPKPIGTAVQVPEPHGRLIDADAPISLIDTRGKKVEVTVAHIIEKNRGIVKAIIPESKNGE